MASLLVALLASAMPLAAAPAAKPLDLFDKNAGALSLPVQIVLLLTLMTVLPAVFMSVTPFLRITLVLHFLRQALGTQSAPSNQVLVGLSMFLTLLIMQPVLSEAYYKGWIPLEKGDVAAPKAWEEGSRPLKKFLLRFCREKDIQLLVDITKTPAPARAEDVDIKILVPAYVLSELRTGFQIGAVLFLPFLIIDLIVASVTLSIGMVQLPPVMLSAPFKILLFVLADGWNLVVGALIRSFYQGGG